MASVYKSSFQWVSMIDHERPCSTREGDGRNCTLNFPDFTYLDIWWPHVAIDRRRSTEEGPRLHSFGPARTPSSFLLQLVVSLPSYPHRLDLTCLSLHSYEPAFQASLMRCSRMYGVFRTAAPTIDRANNELAYYNGSTLATTFCIWNLPCPAPSYCKPHLFIIPFLVHQ